MQDLLITVFIVAIISFNTLIAYVLQRAYVKDSWNPVMHWMHVILGQRWVRLLILVPPMSLVLVYASAIAHIAYEASSKGWPAVKRIWRKYINNIHP